MFIKLNEKDHKNIYWMEETVEQVPSNKKLYKLICFLMGRRKKKFSYKELYMIYTHIYNFRKNDILEIKQKSMKTLLEIYKENNGNYPDIII